MSVSIEKQSQIRAQQLEQKTQNPTQQVVKDNNLESSPKADTVTLTTKQGKKSTNLTAWILGIGTTAIAIGAFILTKGKAKKPSTKAIEQAASELASSATPKISHTTTNNATTAAQELEIVGDVLHTRGPLRNVTKGKKPSVTTHTGQNPEININGTRKKSSRPQSDFAGGLGEQPTGPKMRNVTPKTKTPSGESANPTDALNAAAAGNVPLAAALHDAISTGAKKAEERISSTIKSAQQRVSDATQKLTKSGTKEKGSKLKEELKDILEDLSENIGEKGATTTEGGSKAINSLHIEDIPESAIRNIDDLAAHSTDEIATGLRHTNDDLAESVSRSLDDIPENVSFKFDDISSRFSNYADDAYSATSYGDDIAGFSSFGDDFGSGLSFADDMF